VWFLVLGRECGLPVASGAAPFAFFCVDGCAGLADSRGTFDTGGASVTGRGLKNAAMDFWPAPIPAFAFAAPDIESALASAFGFVISDTGGGSAAQSQAMEAQVSARPSHDF
jgi:hypothetical protein